MREIGRGLAVLLIGVASLAASDSFALPVVPPSFSARVFAVGLGGLPQAVDVTPDGTIYVAGSPGGVFRVTPSGQVFPLNGPFSGQELQGVIVRDSDDVFVSSLNSVFRLAPGASAFSVFSYNPSLFNANAIAGDLVLRGASLFMVGQYGSFPPLWTVDATTGTFAAFETDPDEYFTALAYDPRADVLIGAGPWGLIEIDPETGSAKMFSFSGPGVPVREKPPEPAERNHRTVIRIPFRTVGQAPFTPLRATCISRLWGITKSCAPRGMGRSPCSHLPGSTRGPARPPSASASTMLARTSTSPTAEPFTRSAETSSPSRAPRPTGSASSRRAAVANRMR